MQVLKQMPCVIACNLVIIISTSSIQSGEVLNGRNHLVHRFILECVIHYYTYTNRMKYRSRLEIVASMLQVASSGDASRTTIMYKSFISHAQLKEFLSFLLQKGLILEYHKEEGKSHREERSLLYKTTEKGLYLLHLYGEMNELLGLQKDEA